MQIIIDNIEYELVSKQSHTPKPQAEKPPLGLMPEWLHKEQRQKDINDAIHRYIDNNKPVPLNWIAEEYSLKTWLSNYEEEKKTPQAENKPDIDWEIIAYSCGYMGLDNIVFHKEANGQFRTFDYRLTPDQKEYSYPEDAITNSKIHSVKRKSDGITFSVGDEVGYYDCVEPINNFYINEYDKKMWAKCYRDKIRGTVFDCPLSELIKQPQPQKEEQRIEVLEIEDGYGAKTYGEYWINIRTKGQVSKGKFSAIKQAIEQVLNDEKVYEMFGTEFMMIPKAEYNKYLQSLNS